MSAGHQDPDTIRPPGAVRRSMARNRAYDVAIGFAMRTDMPCLPIANDDGSWDARVPMEYLEGWLEAVDDLEPIQ